MPNKTGYHKKYVLQKILRNEDTHICTKSRNFHMNVEGLKKSIKYVSIKVIYQQ